MRNYTCSACCFQMNARKQPKSCPRCGYVDASLRPKKTCHKCGVSCEKEGYRDEFGPICLACTIKAGR